MKRLRQRIAATALLLIACLACTDKPSVPSSPVAQALDDPATQGVLVLNAPPQLQVHGCKHIVAWDDAAAAYYANRQLNTGYCKWEIGTEAIPGLEEMRKKRGLPPGSYKQHQLMLEAIEAQMKGAQPAALPAPRTNLDVGELCFAQDKCITGLRCENNMCVR